MVERNGLAGKGAVLRRVLDERQLRLWAASEARALGRGGVSAVARATGISRNRVAAGLAEPAGLEQEAPGRPVRRQRVRRAGGGRKPLAVTDGTLLADLEALVDPLICGDPESPLRRVPFGRCKSTAQLAAALRERGHRVTPRTVARLLQQQQYSLQGTRKAIEGVTHPDRDAQFQHINAQTLAFQRRGQPVISVDTKKKELVGNFKNVGHEWQPVGTPVRVNTHDFPDPDLGKAIPYGVFDVTANQGWVTIGTDHDTPDFAVQSIRTWWRQMGSRRYPAAAALLVMADGGGSNSSRARQWKVALQALADDLRLPITVCHFPPGTSNTHKWAPDKIEHRMFCHITENRRGRPLVSHEAIVNLIGSTTTQTGLSIQAALDTNRCPTGIKVADETLAAVRIERADFHGEWNYTILPTFA